uniref:Uncharacterized protein n=1 Tax=Leersia perrieri TaxID=77586 RepID=A0A0D9VJP0_9ORYZ
MGMRCKKHPYQAGGGVCATCLGDRLLALAAAQNGGGGASSPPPRDDPPAAAPPAFPRSVSPYVSRRKSDSLGGGGGGLKHHPSLLFFRTPQVGPAYGGSSGALEEGDIGYEKQRRAGKFSVLATLFGHHRSEEKDKESRNRSWLAVFMPRRRKKQQAPAPAAAAAASCPPLRRSCRVVSNRGLSPERNCDGSDEESSSPAADPPWQPSPSPMRRTPCRRRQPSTMPSGFAVCLSPLVRPSPGRRHRSSVQPPDLGSFSCELRPSPLHHLSSAASITRCRSRKLVDGGRFR